MSDQDVDVESIREDVTSIDLSELGSDDQDDQDEDEDEDDLADYEAAACAVDGADGSLIGDVDETLDDDLGDFESELAKLDAEREREELRELDVGDHVAVRDEPEDDRATMIVLATPIDRTAGEYEVDGTPLTEYDGNEDAPEDDDVVEVTYASRTDVRLTDGRTYAYPRSRLEVVAGVHDRDEDSRTDE